MSSLLLSTETTFVSPPPPELGHQAMQALLAEVNLPGKPGLVGPDGTRSHADMDVELMRLSARTLEPTFTKLAEAGNSLEVGQELRDVVGEIGREGEEAMLTATGGVNTHRGAIWNLGLMVIATAGLGQQQPRERPCANLITRRAGRLASIPDSFTDHRPRPGATARKRFRVGGAVSEAAAGFPHVLAALRGMSSTEGYTDLPPTNTQKLRGLLTSMSSLDDTCVLHRGGQEGLEFVQSGALALLAVSTSEPATWATALKNFDHQLAERDLSAGGSADLLACALFLTSILGAEHADNQ